MSVFQASNCLQRLMKHDRPQVDHRAAPCFIGDHLWNSTPGSVDVGCRYTGSGGPGVVVQQAGEQLHELVAFGRTQRREQFVVEVVQDLVEEA